MQEASANAAGTCWRVSEISSSVAEVPGTTVPDASVVPPPASRTVTSALTASVGVVDATDIRLNDELSRLEASPVPLDSATGWPAAFRYTSRSWTPLGSKAVFAHAERR